jgi:hypothetical protein
MPETKSQSKFLIPAISTAIVIGGGIAAYLYFKSPGDSTSPMGTAKVVPASALMATYINTDPQSWNKLQQFGTPEAQKLLTTSLQNLDQNLLGNGDFSYEEDIKPWIGGVMVAMLPPTPETSSQENESTPPQQEASVLLVVGIKDKLNALNFANKFKEQNKAQIEEIDYKGQKILVSNNNDDSNYVVVLNNTYILLAAEKQAVEKAIDTYQGEASFASQPGASSILSTGVNLENNLAQIYVPNYANMAEKMATLNPQGRPLQQQTIEQLKQVKSLVAGLGVDDSGLRFKAVANLDPNLSKIQYENSPGKIVSQFPSDTIALVTGQNINRSWQTFLEQSKDIPQINQGVQIARTQVKSLANLDLDKDVFGWMDGEFAFGAVKSNQGWLANVGFGGAIFFNTSDRKTAEATFSQLDEIAKQRSLNVTQTDIAGKKITEWKSFQGALIARGWLDQNTLFVAIGGPLAETLADNKGQTLNNSNTFKTITASLPKPNAGYFYIDMNSTIPLVNRFITGGQPLPPDLSAILSSINGLGVTVNSPNKSTAEMEMLLNLKQNR